MALQVQSLNKNFNQLEYDPCGRCWDQSFGICADISKPEFFTKCMNDPIKHRAYLECKKHCLPKVKIEMAK